MDHFPDVKKIPFEGPKSRNPLAFRYYNADEVVEGKIAPRPPAIQRLLLAHFPGDGGRSVRGADPPASLGRRQRVDRKCQAACRRGLRVHLEARGSLLLLP